VSDDGNNRHLQHLAYLYAKQRRPGENFAAFVARMSARCETRAREQSRAKDRTTKPQAQA